MKNQMSEEARRAKNEYNRHWRVKNPDKIRQYQVNYWEHKAINAEDPTDGIIAARLHEQGFSLREIGEKIGVSHMTVKRLLQRP